MLALGVHRPRRFDGEPGANERRGQRVPRLDFLVGKHDGQHAAIREHAVHLAERPRHLALVIGLGQVLLLAAHIGEPGDIGHGLVVFVREFIGEELGVDVAQAAFHPHVEEIRALRVHHVVVIRRVCIDMLDAAVRAMFKIRRAPPPDLDRHVLRLTGEPAAVPARQLRNPGIGIHHLVQHPGDQIPRRIKLGVAPLKTEIVAIERSRYNASSRVPTHHARVIIRCLIKRNTQIRRDRLCPLFVEFLEYLLADVEEGFEERAHGEKLPRGEQLAPESHAVSARLGCLVSIGDNVVGHEPLRFPVGQALGEFFLGGRDGLFIFLGGGDEGEATGTFDGKRVELLPHAAGLGFGLDVVAVDGLVVRPGRDGVAALDRAVVGPGLPALLGAGDDAERRLLRVVIEHGKHGDRFVPLLQPPVRRQGNGLARVGAGHRARPDVGVNRVAGLDGEEGFEALLDLAYQQCAVFRDVFAEFRSKAEGIVERGLEDDAGHGVEFVGKGGEPVAERLEGDRTAARERVEHAEGLLAPGVFEQHAQGVEVFPIRIHGERAGMRIGRGVEFDALLFCPGDEFPAGNRIAKDAAEFEEPLVVGVFGGELLFQVTGPVGLPDRKDAGQYRSTARRERPPRPPHVEEVEGG